MFKFIINPPVFFGAIFLIGIFVLTGAAFTDHAEALFSALQSGILTNFGWFYLLSVGIFLISIFILGFSRYGDLKLGPDDSEPDFKYISWVAMLFAAGMGIGLMYFAVGEPMTHYILPPEAEPLSIAAQRQAISLTFFHWGIHAWAIYAVVGLSLAYFGYRYNLPLTIRSGLYPIFKNRINGWLGHTVDIFAICGTVFGIATSLGFGVLQISAGLEYLTGYPASLFMQVALITGIMGLATISVVTGLDKGIRILSELNILIAIGLMLFILFVGPTALLMRDFVQNIGLYLDDILLRTFNIYAYEPKPWIDAWTLFYWAWWISWSPFVGMFIARISRGRTVREFILAVLFIPTGFTFFWMTVFGNTAMFLDQTVAAGALSAAVSQDISVALFQFFQYMPMPTVLSVLAVILVSIFFVTSADSGSLVVDTIAAGGETETTTLQRVFWCALEGIVAIILLVTGGLAALQSATIASALPFTVIMLMLVFGLFRGMKADMLHIQNKNATSYKTAAPASDIGWQRRLARALQTATKRDVTNFIETRVHPALEDVAAELIKRGKAATVTLSSENISLSVHAEGIRDFIYGVQPISQNLPGFTPHGATRMKSRFEARTYFSDGSKGYDIMGMTPPEIITDVLIQFEQYLSLTASSETTLLTEAPAHEGTS